MFKFVLIVNFGVSSVSFLCYLLFMLKVKCFLEVVIHSNHTAKVS